MDHSYNNNILLLQLAQSNHLTVEWLGLWRNKSIVDFICCHPFPNETVKSSNMNLINESRELF